MSSFLTFLNFTECGAVKTRLNEIARNNRERMGKEMFYLTTHSTHFIYGYMVSDIWLRTILIVRKETCCRHIGYSFQLTSRFFYMHHPIDRIAHTTAFVTPVVEHWLDNRERSYSIGLSLAHGQVRSGQVRVVAHACHGHRYRHGLV